jgi:hypothetical protein
MSSNFVETGWQRFLNRVRPLWGQSRDPDPATNANPPVVGFADHRERNAAVEQNTVGPPAPTDTDTADRH